MRKPKGFSLIELLIVIAIILIIAAIAIPSLMRSRMLANQSSAAHTIRTLITAQSTYIGTYGTTQGYAINLVVLGPAGIDCPPPPAIPPPTNACLIDGQLSATGVKNSYNFNMNPGGGGAGIGPTNFAAYASPVAIGSTGINDYCGGDDGVLYFQPATGLGTAVPCGPVPPFIVLN
jgi:type IV pilus assembly protein PilA